MSKRKLLKKINTLSNKGQKIGVVLVVLVVAIIGIRLLVGSHAATPYAVVDANTGTLGGSAEKVASSAATDGTYVQFGALPSTTTTGSGVPLLGLWDNGTVGPSQLGVTEQVVSDYADNSDYCSYPSMTSLSSNQTLMLAVGACSESEAESMATTLKDGGQTKPIIRIMWEGNQDSSGWFDDWNQGTFTSASAYEAAFNTVAEGFRAVLPDAVIMYNPNAGDNNSGEKIDWQSEDPGTENVIGVDAYDEGSWESNIQAIVSYAASKNIPWALPEWGLDGSDDPSYINEVHTLVENSNCYVQAYFSYAGSINSDLTQFSSSLAAFKSDFAGQ